MKTNKNNININIANLKKSNVLIFSNTYIVGLKYDKEITSAPIVTYLSKKIKETEKFAQDLSISIIKNNIADKIVSILDIGDEIPVSLYLPIAQIYASILTKNEIDFSELLNDEVFDSNFASGLCIEFAPDLYKKMMKVAITTKLEKLRKKIIADLGLVIIPIKINKNLSLAQGKYFIKLNRDILLESDLSDSITNKTIETFSKQTVVLTQKSTVMEAVVEESIYSNEELYEILKAIKLKKKYVLLKNNKIITLDNEEANEFYELVDDLKIDKRKVLSHQAIPIYQSLKAYAHLNNCKIEAAAPATYVSAAAPNTLFAATISSPYIIPVSAIQRIARFDALNSTGSVTI